MAKANLKPSVSQQEQASAGWCLKKWQELVDGVEPFAADVRSDAVMTEKTSMIRMDR
jgi:hypothetical protein